MIIIIIIIIIIITKTFGNKVCCYYFCFVIKVNAIKLSTFRCRLDTIIKTKVEGNGRS